MQHIRTLAFQVLLRVDHPAFSYQPPADIERSIACMVAADNNERVIVAICEYQMLIDEKTQIQALDRSQPVLPMRPGQAERQP